MSGNNNKNPTSSTNAITEFRDIKAHQPYNAEWSIKLTWEPSRKKLDVQFNPSKKGRFYHDLEAGARLANQLRIAVDVIIKNIVHTIGEIPNNRLPFFFNDLEQSPIFYDLFMQLESVSSTKHRQRLLAEGIHQYVKAFLQKLTVFTYQQFDQRAHNTLTTLQKIFKDALIVKLKKIGFNIQQASDVAEAYCQDDEQFKPFKKIILTRIQKLRAQFKEDIRLLTDPNYNFSEILAELTSYAELFSLRAWNSIQENQAAESTGREASDQKFAERIIEPLSVASPASQHIGYAFPEEEKADDKLPAVSPTIPLITTEPPAEIPTKLPLIDNQERGAADLSMDSPALTSVAKEDSKELKSTIPVINFSEIFSCDISLYNGNLDLSLEQTFKPKPLKYIAWHTQKKSSEKQCTIQAINFIKHAIFHLTNKKYSKANPSLKSALQCLSERANFLKDKPSDAFQVLGVIFCTYYLSKCAENDKRLQKGVLSYCNNALDILAKQIAIAAGDRLKQLQQLKIQIEAAKTRLQEIIQAEKVSKPIVSSVPDNKSLSAPIAVSSAEISTTTPSSPTVHNPHKSGRDEKNTKDAMPVVPLSEQSSLMGPALTQPEGVLIANVEDIVSPLCDTTEIEQLSKLIREQELYLLAIIEGHKPMKAKSIDQHVNTNACMQQLLSLKDLYKAEATISQKLTVLEQRIAKIAINRKIIIDINLSKEQLKHRIQKDAAALKHIESQASKKNADISSLDDYHVYNSRTHSLYDYHFRSLREHEGYLENIRAIARYLQDPEGLKPQEIKRGQPAQMPHAVLAPTPQPHYSALPRTSLAQGSRIGHSLEALFAAVAAATVFKPPSLGTPKPGTTTNRQPLW